MSGLERPTLYCSESSKTHTPSSFQIFQVLNGAVITQPLILRNVLSDIKLCKNSVRVFRFGFWVLPGAGRAGTVV